MTLCKKNEVAEFISIFDLIMFNLYDGQYCDLYIGYCIAEGTEAEILTTLVKWSSYILFDLMWISLWKH